MPGYIGYRPQFQPISLQEYLAVPTMIVNDYEEAEKEFNEYQDKVAAVEALAGNNEKAMNIINQYKAYLGDAANGLTNGVKNVDSYKAARQARNYYRNSVMKLEPAITAYQNAQKTRAAKDDGTLIGPELSLDNYIDNPLYEDRFVHGSAIQKEAMQAAAQASARRKSEKTPSKALGNQYWQLGSQMGFTPDEVNAWLADPTSSPELTAIANQIAEKYGEFDMNKVGQYITRGILDGIAYDNKTAYQSNKAYDAALTAAKKKSSNSQEDELVARFMSQSNPSPDYSSPSSDGTEAPITKKILTGPVSDRSSIQSFFNGVQQLTGVRIPFVNREVKTYEGTLSASADFYNNEANRTKAANQSNNQLVSSLNETFGRNVRESYVKFNDKSLNTIRQYGKSNFARYKTVDEIPENVKTQFVNSLKTANYTAGMIPSNPTQEQINLLVDIGFSSMQNTTRRAPAPNSSYLTEKEFNDLKRKGVQFYNQDGSVRSEQEILWDAWDYMPKQYDKYSLTAVKGAGDDYREAATKSYFDEFPKNGKVQTNEGKEIILKPSKDKGYKGFEGYAPPEYYLSARNIRNDKKILSVTNDSGDTYTVDVPLSRREVNIKNSLVNQMRAQWLARLVSNNIIDLEYADSLKRLSINDFLKYIEIYGENFGGLGFTINDIVDEIDDAILMGEESNIIPKSGETDSKAYK